MQQLLSSPAFSDVSDGGHPASHIPASVLVRQVGSTQPARSHSYEGKYLLVLGGNSPQNSLDIRAHCSKCFRAHDLDDWFANYLFRSQSEHLGISAIHKRITQVAAALRQHYGC